MNGPLPAAAHLHTSVRNKTSAAAMLTGHALSRFCAHAAAKVDDSLPTLPNTATNIRNQIANVVTKFKFLRRFERPPIAAGLVVIMPGEDKTGTLAGARACVHASCSA